jgi:hypothetical protein
MGVEGTTFTQVGMAHGKPTPTPSIYGKSLFSYIAEALDPKTGSRGRKSDDRHRRPDAPKHTPVKAPGPLKTVEAGYGKEVPYNPFSRQNSVEHRVINEADMEINGVPIPDSVADELRELGIPLCWYTRGELMEAVLAYTNDGHVLDEQGALSQRDRLRSDAMERECDAAEQRAGGDRPIDTKRVSRSLRRLRVRRPRNLDGSLIMAAAQASAYVSPDALPLPPPSLPILIDPFRAQESVPDS